MDRWIPKPAGYQSIARAYHCLLMGYCAMPAEEAVEYTPHGLRHLLPTAAQQFRTIGLAQSEDIETLGHWEPGSWMPKRYHGEAGVTELALRHKIMTAFQKGWTH